MLRDTLVDWKHAELNMIDAMVIIWRKIRVLLLFYFRLYKYS